jgi:hypothetical protein
VPLGEASACRRHLARHCGVLTCDSGPRRLRNDRLCRTDLRRSLREKAAVTPEGEALAVRDLQAWLRAELAAFPTSLEEDARFLQQAAASASPSSGGDCERSRAAYERRLLAVRYRLERKLLLAAGLEILELWS